MAPLAGALTVFLGAAGAWLVLRWLGDALNPPGWTAPERVPFAGGKPPRVHAWSRFHVRYYAMALLFLAFDMEMVY
ncbi:MAG: NADH-quinone oxidoreductase subunit A, partial [Gemmatimonadetes bacterium]|nr:NADH-quinone oxidoreductase subunit A [Gemmatimonadota bacterium]